MLFSIAAGGLEGSVLVAHDARVDEGEREKGGWRASGVVDGE